MGNNGRKWNGQYEGGLNNEKFEGVGKWEGKIKNYKC